MSPDQIIEFYHSAADFIQNMAHTLPFVPSQSAGDVDNVVCGWHIGVDAGYHHVDNLQQAMNGAVQQSLQQCKG
ncbi:hypothetical protein GSS88_06710 [Corynebacterium sp. 3HC-13]|uniref:hypothetical protein n=1 Tax=Corynebacterium poyangense TaxID=2684405 RepID=UPI001CCAD0B5|nr:hypothetical protein [Corynebacterium poyangense]MBZ8177485.1 hypothetical protein [Corynebacterium poyangense]